MQQNVLKKILSNLFSIKNVESRNKKYYRVLTLFGLKLKTRNKKKELLVKLADCEKQLKIAKKMKQVYSHGINKEKISYEINLFNKLGVTEQKRDKKLIVSLTSYPARMYDIHYTIYSLLNQTVKPDEIILWLVKEEFKNAVVSPRVLEFQKHGLTIKWIDRKLKPYGKLIPALEEYPNDIIITADDDIYYPTNWLEILYEEYQKAPNLIHAHRCHKVDLEKSYEEWDKEVEGNSIGFSNFLTGVGGVLYPPNSLHKDVLNEALFKELSPNADDIWFWAMAVLAGTKIKTCENNITSLTYTTPEREFGLYGEQTLCSYNCGQSGNDIQLEKVLNHYPQIKKALLDD